MIDSDLGVLVHEIRFGRFDELHFWLDYETDRMTVEIVSRGGKHVGWLARNVKPETIAKKFAAVCKPMSLIRKDK
jgi:hypothetical protein